MTEDIPSDRHEKRSSQEIAVFSERLRNYERREKEATYRDQLILDTLGRIKETLSAVNTQLALGDQRMDQIDHHLKATDTTVSNLQAVLEADKRGPVAIVLATVSALATGAVAFFK